MTNTSWLPSLWKDWTEDTGSPFSSLRKQIDSLFEDFDHGSSTSKSAGLVVRSNVSETDKEICITAELPGIEEKDVDVSVTGNRITIKGEKKSEKEEKKDEEGRQFHRIERSSGSFYRSMTLPFEIEADAVKAEVKNGVLTVNISKPATEIEKTKKIEVQKGN